MKLLDTLLEIPSAIEDNYLSSVALFNESANYEVVVIASHVNSKVTTIKVKILPINLICDLVFFQFKPYLKKIFLASKTLHIKGILENQNGFCKIIQPKIVQNINQIVVKYKTNHPKLQQQSCAKELEDFGFTPQLIHLLLTIHFPTRDYVREYLKIGGIYGDYLKAIKYLECFNSGLKLSKKKFDFMAKNILDRDFASFIKSLPFTLTQDQLSALEDIRADFRSTKASKRIIVGDVGSGKTMIILSCAFMALPFRSVLLAPTTVLANQIYEEAKKYLGTLAKITLFTNKNKPKKSLEEFDFIIGTHALLYENLPDIDLIMVDEQHRFGTNQRNLIDRLQTTKQQKKPHFLQFSATPIPRTQAMIESSMVDFSFLRQTPFEKDIQTSIITKNDFSSLLEHIDDEIKQHHQVIIVYPLVEENEDFGYVSIAKGELFWKSRFENVFATHGKDKNKESVLECFRDEGDILLATTLIEVGISLPRLTTIVIVGAERLGLASLHQLRGRVSRNGLKGYCYLYTNHPKSEKLAKFAQTKSGFEIAELDLKMRNSGDLLEGVTQSGLNFRFLNLATDQSIVARATSDLKEYLLLSKK